MEGRGTAVLRVAAHARRGCRGRAPRHVRRLGGDHAAVWEVRGPGGSGRPPGLPAMAPPMATTTWSLRVTAKSLLASLRGRGLGVQRVGPALHVSPRAALTDADRAAIREHLVDLRALVGAAVV